jgi:DNA polymerase-3 subunit delta
MVSSIQLFHGAEDFLIDEEITKLKEKALSSGTGGMNFEIVDGASASMEQMVNSVSSAPLLGGEKVIVIKDPLFLKSAKRRRKKTKAEADDEAAVGEDLGPFRAIIENIPDGIRIIFVVYGNVDRRRRAFKLIDGAGEVREFKPFAEWEQEKLLSWIVSRVKLQGKKIGSHAARLLMETSGSNLRALSQEIAKLVTYIGEKEGIEEPDVAALASEGRMSVFSLISSLRDRNLKVSLESLARLMREKEEPIALLGLMASQFRMLLQVKSLQEQGLSEREIAMKLGANFFFVKKSAERSHNFSLAELIRIMELLHKADLRIKRGRAAPHIALEGAIIGICMKGAGHAEYQAKR